MVQTLSVISQAEFNIAAEAVTIVCYYLIFLTMQSNVVCFNSASQHFQIKKFLLAELVKMTGVQLLLI